jgi:N6-L-threonylcarbamoyladenine synthase
LLAASKKTGVKEIAIAGGVSANSLLRETILKQKEKRGWNVFIPELQYSTDNAAMISIAGYFKYQSGQFADQKVSPYSRSGN